MLELPGFRFNLFTNRNWKVRSLQVVNHGTFVYALLHGWTPLWLLSFAVYFFMFCIGINVGVHRYFSHGSFKASRFSEWVMGIAMCLATLGSPLAWVGMHRVHHRFSDGAKDPHSPLDHHRLTFRSFGRAYLGLWGRYVAGARHTFDLRQSGLHKVLHFYYFAVIFAWVAILALIKPELVIYMYCVPAVFSFHAASLIVTVGHATGHRQFETRDQSRNNVILHWLTLGEGLHNYHHAYPNKDFYTGTPWYFFDLPGLVLRVFFKTPDFTSGIANERV
jgi:stearoyl-CoA desaturase (delta-9 desaturase)